MNIALWIVAGLMAAAFFAAGLMKVSTPKEKLAEKMPWVQDFSEGQVKAIGAVEVLGALGLVLPQATGIAPILTPLAAAGLAITMLAAARVHIRRKEQASVPVNLVLFVLVTFVAIGRFA